MKAAAPSGQPPQHVVIWEEPMDAGTVLLTVNTETVYAIAHLELKNDGPTIVEAPPMMLGFLQSGIQRYIIDIGPLGPDKGQGGKFLVLPPDYAGDVPKGYFAARSPTYSVTFAVRGFQEGGRTAPAVALMKQIKVYALSKAGSPPPMQFTNGSHRQIDTVLPDNDRFFDLLAMLVEEDHATSAARSSAFKCRRSAPAHTCFPASFTLRHDQETRRPQGSERVLMMRTMRKGRSSGAHCGNLDITTSRSTACGDTQSPLLETSTRRDTLV